MDFADPDAHSPDCPNKFYQDLKKLQENNLCQIWIVRDEETPVAFMAISMGAIEVEVLGQEQAIEKTTPLEDVSTRYPAMFVVKMAVDNRYRGNGIGTKMGNFCIGLAAEISERVACRYVALQSPSHRVKFFKDLGFVESQMEPTKPDDTTWMYFRMV